MAKHRGFTTIELLVVITIIAMLLGMVLLGARYATNQSRISATRVTLENLKSMLAEAQAKTKHFPIPSGWYQPDSGNWYTYTAGLTVYRDFWRVPWETAAAVPFVYRLYVPVNPVTLEAFSVAILDREQSAAVRNTAIVMYYLTRTPANRDAIEKLPSSQVLRIADAPRLPLSPVLLDAWNNPIIYVPATGLAGVQLEPGGPATTIVSDNSVPVPDNVPQWEHDLDSLSIRAYSRGDFAYYQSSKGTTIYYCIQNALVGAANPAVATDYWQPVNLKPFFASAGSDGSFQSGADNLYSFEQ